MSDTAHGNANSDGVPSAEEIAEAKAQLEKAKQQFQQAESLWEDDAFIKALAQKPQAERDAAFQRKLDIGTQLLKIENVRLALITRRVQENSQALDSAITDVSQALQRLQDVTRILNALGSLLAIVARIVTL